MANSEQQVANEFNLEPDPRVLPMLGEINIPQWRCIAELVDNAVDGFLKEKNNLAGARVDVYLPQADIEDALLTIIDNGPGMTPDMLEHAARAGWSGNNPIDSLGLFGMGFNIATARLGSETEVWTTRKGGKEWHGLNIDFDKLRRQRHFRTSHLIRAKADSDQHGTEIKIKQLKPEQRKWLAKNANQSTIRKMLSHAYSSMLRDNGMPINFSLHVNNNRVEAQRYCIWDSERTVPSSDGLNIHAVIQINCPLAERLYCTNCMNWVFETAEDTCAICNSTNSIIQRQRNVKGWLGIQRFLHENEYGIDFLRNGRKIELANKDLFIWNNGEMEEREYPIDDPRNRGRIVGEIHIDHCRVSYAKDRFDRTDPSWDDMIRIIRGEGPLRPEKAKELGYGPNDSYLFQLFKAFRRTSPKSKSAGAYGRLLLVKDNARAIEMAKSFNDGIPEYQDDSKWWELVEAADHELLHGSIHPGTNSDEPSSGNEGNLPSGLLDQPDTGSNLPPSKPEPQDEVLEPKPPRQENTLISRTYYHAGTGIKWKVVAFNVEENDPELNDDMPWRFFLADVPNKTYHFLYNPAHIVFESITLTPLDALLSHLAHMTADQTRNSTSEQNFARILADFRAEYGQEMALDFATLPNVAASVLIDVAQCLTNICPEEHRASLFNDLNLNQREEVMRSLANKKIKPAEATVNGTFLASGPFEIVQSVIEKHPELCFDGKLWDTPYIDLDYGMPKINEEARADVLARYLSLLRDAIWLSKQDSHALISHTRSEIIRAVMSLEVLKPDVEI